MNHRSRLLPLLFLLACATEHDESVQLSIETRGDAGAPAAGAAGSGAAGVGGAAGLAGVGAAGAVAGASAGGAASAGTGGAAAGSAGVGGPGGAGQGAGAGGDAVAGASGAGQGGSGGAAGKGGAGSGGAGKGGAGAGGAGAGSGGKAGAGAGGAGSGGAGASAGSGGAGQGGAAGAGGAGQGGASGGCPDGTTCCPDEMTWVADGACVDRWEAQVEVEEAGVWNIHSPYETLDGVVGLTRATSAPGVVPQGYISGAQARAACEGAGKRLCSRTEYRTACEGPAMTTYPYGDTHEKGACNEGRPEHPIIELFGSGPDVFNGKNMNDPAVNQLPDSLATTGSHPLCVSGYGAFDMVGNLHEWVDEDAGTFCGGFYVDAEINGSGCLYTTTAHAFTYHDYSTGFRCCLSP